MMVGVSRQFVQSNRPIENHPVTTWFSLSVKHESGVEDSSMTQFTYAEICLASS